jgi:hypothetical protein
MEGNPKMAQTLREIPTYNPAGSLITKKMLVGEGIKIRLWKDLTKQLVAFDIELIMEGQIVSIKWNERSTFGENETFSTTVGGQEEHLGMNYRVSLKYSVSIDKGDAIEELRKRASNLRKETLSFILLKMNEHMDQGQAEIPTHAKEETELEEVIEREKSKIQNLWTALRLFLKSVFGCLG